jgi:hypothetical protein
MSGFTMTQTELLYAFYGAATTSVPTTTTPVTITAAMPEISVPAGFMQVLGKRSSSLVLELGGYLSTSAATPPTWSFGLAYTQPSPPTFSGSAGLCTATTAVSPTASSSGSWIMRARIGLRALGVGAASTVWCDGDVDSNLFAAAPLLLNPGGSGGTSMSTWQSDLEYYLWPYLVLSAGTAGNTVTTQWAKLYGEN